MEVVHEVVPKRKPKLVTHLDVEQLMETGESGATFFNAPKHVVQGVKSNLVSVTTPCHKMEASNVYSKMGQVVHAMR